MHALRGNRLGFRCLELWLYMLSCRSIILGIIGFHAAHLPISNVLQLDPLTMHLLHLGGYYRRANEVIVMVLDPDLVTMFVR